MRLFSFCAAAAILFCSAGECTPKSKYAASNKLKGRLEIAGICMNYTISVLNGDPGEGAIVANWTDEVTNKSYSNVFRLGNPCVFPATIKQGDEFYFTIDTSEQKPCMVCEAFYPTPSKSLAIKVTE